MSMYTSHQFSGLYGEYIKVLFEDVNNGRNIPINRINLNQVGSKKHFLTQDELEHNEFYVYGVTQVNMKKVLTIRT